MPAGGSRPRHQEETFGPLDSHGDEIISAAMKFGYNHYGFEDNPGNVDQDHSQEQTGVWLVRRTA
jgi:hypothetical protein